ncbi:hypothetical protein BV20DRAFT_836696 [Pilatotrama ljubarskyi]|nr:hypothetical protein BV20DRAFT_836696 [Pilatotrama ljubarskyi]
MLIPIAGRSQSHRRPRPCDPAPPPPTASLPSSPSSATNPVARYTSQQLLEVVLLKGHAESQPCPSIVRPYVALQLSRRPAARPDSCTAGNINDAPFQFLGRGDADADSDDLITPPGALLFARRSQALRASDGAGRGVRTVQMRRQTAAVPDQFVARKSPLSSAKIRSPSNPSSIGSQSHSRTRFRLALLAARHARACCSYHSLSRTSR